MATNYTLKAGHAITVTAGARAGSAHQVEDGSVGAVLQPGHSRTFGPYLLDRNFTVSDGASVSTAESTAATAFGGLFIPNAGAPEDAVRASASVNPTGDDNGLTITARAYGADGNKIRVTYTDPGAASQALSVSVAATSILVSLATDESAVITSTAAEVKAAIEAKAEANNLVSVAIMTSDSGAGDDGSGVVTDMTVTALTGGAGTGIAQARPGCLCIDTTGGKLYRNTGTQAAPAWVSDQDLHLYGAGAPVDYTDGSPPATGEGTAYAGALYTDTTNANVYRNDGSRAQPVWVQLGDAA